MPPPPPFENQPFELSFDELPDDAADELLRSCLAVPRWIEAVRAGRPYRDRDALLAAADRAAAALTPAEVDAALARHPRIGEHAGAGHDAAFSRREQAAMGSVASSLAAAIREGNLLYENRFGRVFLIRAAGREPAEILAELQRRLGNDQDTEIAETADQLRQIALLRLRSLVPA